MTKEIIETETVIEIGTGIETALIGAGTETGTGGAVLMRDALAVLIGIVIGTGTGPGRTATTTVFWNGATPRRSQG